jgi:hypothetical protein
MNVASQHWKTTQCVNLRHGVERSIIRAGQDRPIVKRMESLSDRYRSSDAVGGSRTEESAIIVDQLAQHVIASKDFAVIIIRFKEIRATKTRISNVSTFLRYLLVTRR